jgi:hypothetical protein
MSETVSMGASIVYTYLIGIALLGGILYSIALAFVKKGDEKNEKGEGGHHH